MQYFIVVHWRHGIESLPKEMLINVDEISHIVEANDNDPFYVGSTIVMKRGNFKLDVEEKPDKIATKLLNRTNVRILT